MNIYDNLIEYSSNDYYPMHMPGHKRNTKMLNMINPYAIDITEIEGFDNLHHAEGVLLDGMLHAAKLYGSKHTNYLVGGSTVGILSGISACTKKGDKVLVARNSHKSVYNAIYLNELNPVYIYPQQEEYFGINGGIYPESIEEMLIKHPDVKLVIITSPTYEGIVSDIKTISKVVHKYNIPLLVDEAHGAHFGFHPGFPNHSIAQGADLVIHSVHKTLPAFTQTGLIHVNGNIVNYNEISRYLSIYQSSSPSYLLMASIEKCVTLLEEKKEELFRIYHGQLEYFYDRMKSLEKLQLLAKDNVINSGFYDFDPSKLVISVRNTNISGLELYSCLLEQYKIQMEMVSKDYVLGMTSICDTEDGFQRLGDALLEIDLKVKYNKSIAEEISNNENWKRVKIESVCSIEESADNKEHSISPDNRENSISSNNRENSISPDNRENSISSNNREQPDIIMPIHKACQADQIKLLLTDSVGRVSTEYVYLYPPGIPLLVPGERISVSLVGDIIAYKESGLSIQGLQDLKGDYIYVVNET